MSGSVCVLTPAGRRQIVKVTPNTSILQILEDVCKKQGFSSNEYDLKHHNKILDLSNTVRFANLPNNAQLELVKSVASKSDSSVVTIGLQLPDGERCFSDCDSNDSVWNILEYWTKQGKDGIFEVNDDFGNVLKPVCIYMRREISSEEELKNTTLRSLGLVTGKAILRLIHRLPNRLVEQAFVEDLILNRPKEEEEDRRVVETFSIKPSKRISVDDIEPHEEMESNISAAETSSSSTVVSEAKKQKSQTIVSVESVRRKLGSGLMEKSEAKQIEANEVNKSDVEMEVDEEEEEDLTGQLNYLDDSGSLLYNLDEVPKPIDVEVPDEFFEVTMDDVRQLMSDLIRQRKELEDIPLKTSALRDAEYLTCLNKYPKSVIRINFPDRLVLQGSFKSTDKIEKVMEFVSQFLVDKDETFYLFTVPPKRVLYARQRLFEVSLTPTGVVHFGCETPLEHFIRDDVMSKISSFRAARRESTTFLKAAKRVDANDQRVSGDHFKLSETTSKSSDVASLKFYDEPSETNFSNNSSQSTSGRSENSETVPKWFVSGKK